MMNVENYDSGFFSYEPAYSPPVSNPYESYQSPPYVPPTAADSGGGEYFGLPYVSLQTGQPAGLSTGLYLAPGQSYNRGPGGSNFLAGYSPSFSGGYPRPSQSGVSYIGPTVSARPAFNLRMRGLRVKDIFKRRRIL